MDFTRGARGNDVTALAAGLQPPGKQKPLQKSAMENPHQPPEAETERPTGQRGRWWLTPLGPLMAGLIGVVMLWLVLWWLFPTLR